MTARTLLAEIGLKEIAAARDAGDAMVIQACQEVIAAHYIGRDRELTGAWEISMAFA